MTTDWRPAVKPRRVAGAVVQTERASFTNEAAHRVTVAGRTIRVAPDGRTTARKRSCIISEALAAIGEANRTLTDADSPSLDPVAYLIGSLMVAGANRIHLVDDETAVPLVPEPEYRVAWQISLHDSGHLEVRHLPGGES